MQARPADPNPNPVQSYPTQMPYKFDTDKRFDEIWRMAIDQYKQDTGVDLQKSTMDASSPTELIELIDKEGARFKEYRKKGENVRAVLMPFLELVDRFSDTAGGVVGVVSVFNTLTYH